MSNKKHGTHLPPLATLSTMPQVTSPVLDIQDLTISVSNQKLVDDVSLAIQAGKTLCLVGESGSGKTLTGLSVMGLLPKSMAVQAKELDFAGQKIQDLSPRQQRKLRGQEVSMIFQEPLSALNPVMKVGDQIAEVFMVHTKMSKPERFAKTIEMLQKVKLKDPERLYHAYPHQLSGGQRQRVMIAMALALSPKLLIADEPTTALDATVQGEILDLMKQLQREENTAILFITHDFGVVKQMADHVAVLEQGKIVEQGTTQQILTKPKKAYTKRLVAAAPTLNTKAKKKIAEDPLLTVEGLSKTYTSGGGFGGPKRTIQALNNASFTLHKGQTVGIVGESGSGKSTLVKCILQLEQPDAGSVILSDQQMVGLKGAKLKQAWRNIQMIFQDPFASLNPRRTVGESIAEGLTAHGIGTKQERMDKVKNLLQAVELEDKSIRRYPHQFSGGQRQRIGIARALALNPHVVVADEAVAALDVSIQKQVLELMEKLKQEHNLSYLFISHDLRVVSQIADWVIVMRNGKIVEQGPTHQVFTKPKQAYTQQLLNSLPG